MKYTILLCVVLFLAAVQARANDGFGGIDATGLEFSRTAKVAMKSEDLFISLDKIRVSYVFENTSSEDVTGEVIFPLPPIPVDDLRHMDTNLPDDPDRENLVNFTVEVDGRKVTPKIERRALRHGRAAETGENIFGEDVTETLRRAGVPLTLNPERLHDVIDELPERSRQSLVRAKLLEVRDGWNGGKEYSYDWAIAIRYHWTQTFPAGAEVAVSHKYENYPPGGIWVWKHPATDDYQIVTEKLYCIDEATSKALTRCQLAYHIDYILRTANTWKGPIGSFRLTIDKGDPRNIVSLCATGVRKTGPTTFVIEKKNYTPEEDLRILIATPGNS